MKWNFRQIAAAVLLAGATLPVSAGEDTRVNLLDFKNYAVGLGTAQADWQPAFQKAVEKAYATSRILYVPAGEYPIRKTVDLWGPNPKNFFLTNSLTVVGDGRSVTSIVQKNPKEDCLTWTGRTYKDGLASGTLKDIAVTGGRIALNIKWHNYFTLQSCYIANASQAGVFSEGWSNRFLDIIVRHCPNIGFQGRDHFNDITIRDGYFSRCGVGIQLGGGARGVRISGIGFEHCANTAILLMSSCAVSITDCYFEGNGMGAPNVKPNWGFPSSIALDFNNSTVQIQNCIFRGCTQYAGHIRMGNNRNVEIRNNFFDIHFDEAAVELTDSSKPGFPALSERVRVADNSLVWSSAKQREMKGAPIPVYYQEKKAGLLKDALEKGGIFEKHEGKTHTGIRKPAPRKGKNLEGIFL